MSKRNYNVFFNTHTVSGIVISVGLYIIFFAGALSFFRGEITFWEQGTQVNHSAVSSVDVDKIIKHLDAKHNLHGRDFSIRFEDNRDYVAVDFEATKDSIANPKGSDSDYYDLNVNDFTTKDYYKDYNLGEFLYRLHFLDPIIYPLGRYLAGLISLFFVFAIITGTIVHWKKIVPNFYSFNPKLILKRIWTDAHTALGVIGLPFQFIYGITGAFFIISILALIPANFLFNGDQQKLMEEMRPRLKTYEWETTSTAKSLAVNPFLKKVEKHWNNFDIHQLSVSNCGGTNMSYKISGELDTKERFVGVGRITYDAYSGEIIRQKSPYEMNYLEDVQLVWGRLHFANFGGITMKIIYFILAIITCFVIITGVLIWVESRNKKSMTLKQRLYTAKIGHIYLAICLSMLPVTALAFIYVRITYGMFENPKDSLYAFYFIVWFLFILFYRFKRDNYFTNKNSLLLGAIFGFLIPIVNGITSGNWFWKTYANQQHEIFTIDIFWIVMASFSLLFYFMIRPKIKEKSSFAKNAIDYKNIKALKAIEKEKLQKVTVTSEIEQPPSNQTLFINKNHIPMRTKIVILWILIIFGYIFHHIYGLATVFFNESVVMEGATGETPMWAHQWRILMEGTAFLFAILTLTLSNKIFKLVSFIWAIVVALFNCYHVTEELLGHPDDISKVFILLLTAVASVLLVVSLWKWYKTSEKNR